MRSQAPNLRGELVSIATGRRYTDLKAGTKNHSATMSRRPYDIPDAMKSDKAIERLDDTASYLEEERKQRFKRSRTNSNLNTPAKWCVGLAAPGQLVVSVLKLTSDAKILPSLSIIFGTVIVIAVLCGRTNLK